MTVPPALVLVGPMGAGKTSIGKRVARALGRRFVDTDALVVAAHGPIPALFTTHGEPYFRRCERESVVEALAQGGVVSLGGGAVLDAHTRSDLAGHDVAFLTVRREVVSARIGGGGQRPLLGGDEDPVARWERIFTEREPLYRAVADATFDTSTGPISDVVTDIEQWARTREREHA